MISRWVLLRMKNISGKSWKENLKTNFMSSNSFFFFWKSCRLSGNAEKYARARQTTVDNIIRRMPFACWITKATNTYSEYVIFTAFPRQQRLCEYASMLCHTYIFCLVLITVISKRHGLCINCPEDKLCVLVISVNFVRHTFLSDHDVKWNGGTVFVKDRTPNTTTRKLNN